eukprot:g18111.t1
MFKGQHMTRNLDWKPRRGSSEWGEPNLCWEPCVGAMKAASGHVEALYRNMDNLDKELALEMMVSNVYGVLPVHEDARGTADDIDYMNPRKKAKAIRETFNQFRKWYDELLEVMFEAVKTQVAKEYSTQLKPEPLPMEQQARVQKYSKIASASAASLSQNVASDDGPDRANQEKKEENQAEQGKNKEDRHEETKAEQTKEEGHDTFDDLIQEAIDAEDYDRDYHLELTAECKVRGRQMYKFGRVMGVVQEMLSPDPDQNSASFFLMHPLALKKVRELGKDKDHACGRWWRGGQYHYQLGINDAEKHIVSGFSFIAGAREAGKKHLLKVMNTKLDAKKSWTMMKMLGDGFKTLDLVTRHHLATAKYRGQAPGAQK